MRYFLLNSVRLYRGFFVSPMQLTRTFGQLFVYLANLTARQPLTKVLSHDHGSANQNRACITATDDIVDNTAPKCREGEKATQIEFLCQQTERTKC